MLKIYSKGENATIEVLGSIGESWFEEGTTLTSVKSQIEELKARNITVKISSLGGDAFEGLAIYDLLKASKKKVTAEIIGATASAGTIVALGADKIKISENALFLVHNAWTVAQGNADDLRKQAENLETVDNRMVAIYTSKTGQEETEVRSLMKEDKWIDANEAYEFGFVDEITEPIKVAASVISAINSSKELPNIEENKININKNFTMTEENKSWFAEQFDAVKASLTKKEEAPVAEVVEEPKEETISKTEVETQLSEINAMIEELKTTNEDLTSQLEAKNQEVEDLNKAVANAKATKVEANAEGTAPDGESTPDTNEVTFGAMKALVKKNRLR